MNLASSPLSTIHALFPGFLELLKVKPGLVLIVVLRLLYPFPFHTLATWFHWALCIDSLRLVLVLMISDSVCFVGKASVGVLSFCCSPSSMVPHLPGSSSVLLFLHLLLAFEICVESRQGPCMHGHFSGRLDHKLGLLGICSN